METTCRNLRLLAEGRGARGEEQPPWMAEVIASLCAGSPGDLLGRFLALRDQRAWPAMYALHESMPAAFQRTPLVRQQLAFALNRDGRGEEAESTLLALLDEAGPSAETCGLLGRVHKDRWDAARRAGDPRTAADELERAIEAYLAGHETGDGDPYPGINALTLSGFSERRRDELGRRLPGELEGYLGSGGATGYWHPATRLELAIYQGSEGDAREALERAVAAARESGAAGEWMVETTCRNLRFLQESFAERGEAAPNWVEELIAELEGA